MVQRLGYPLGKPLPKGAAKPVFGEDPDQRRYSKGQFQRMWGAQFHPMSDDEKANVDRGCIGITLDNLGLDSSTAPPLGEVYGSLEQARWVVAHYNSAFAGPPDPSRPMRVYVMFAMLFWSNQDPDPKKRIKPDPTAYRPDPVTGRVDLSTIVGVPIARSEAHTNFDYGFWDEKIRCFWHANHGEYHNKKNPEEIYQSTKGRFAKPSNVNGQERVTYDDFDRVVYGVAPTTVMPEQVIYDAPVPRKELITAFKAQVSRGEWADAALRLNGFDDDDIKRLARSLTHDERVALSSAAFAAMPGFADRVTNALALVDNEPPTRKVVMSALDASVTKGDWADVGLRLNGLSDDDLKRRLRGIKRAQRAAIAAAAPGAMPGWSDRVTDAIAAIDGALVP